MTNLLKIEFRKNKSYPTFWLLIGFYFVFLFLTVYGIQGMDFSTPTPEGEMQEVSLGYYAFPMVWQSVGYIAGFMGLFLAILVLINITNEFSFRTLRQSIINGQSRVEFLLSKFALVLLISVLATCWVFVTSWAIGRMNLDPEMTVDAFGNVKWMLASFVQILGYLSLAVLFGIFLKNAGIAIFLFLGYVVMMEGVLRFFIPDAIDRFFPANSLSTLIPFPVPTDMIPPEITTGQGEIPFLPDQAFSSVEIIIALVWIVAFWGLSYLLLNKRDL